MARLIERDQILELLNIHSLSRLNPAVHPPGPRTGYQNVSFASDKFKRGHHEVLRGAGRRDAALRYTF
ncbi:hypothetical protein IE991_20920 [Klebsiella pneumoniae]|uniref:Uncharacterized protein n=1 Tax=Klebsiella pneumoniae TaxID=573 RepID=A0A927D9R5_KLEPN|nr:hypothetical protein [Klebsiella pneumoniae]